MNSRARGLVGFRRAVAWLLLPAYLQAAGLVPILLALAASAEAAHSVAFSCSPDHVSIVLQHKHGFPSARPEHHHGVASQVLCVLGRPAQSPSSDHVASFDCPADCLKAAGKFSPAAESIVSGDSHGCFASSLPRLLPPAVPAVALAGLRALRTTVLLI